LPVWANGFSAAVAPAVPLPFIHRFLLLTAQFRHICILRGA